MPHRHCRPNNLHRGTYIQLEDDPLRAGSPVPPPPPAFFLSTCLPRRNVPEQFTPSTLDIEAGPSSLNSTLPVFPPQYPSSPEPTEPPTEIWVISFIHYILSALCMIYTMGLYRLYYRIFRFKENGVTSGHTPFDSTYARWSRIVERMSGIWKLARIGCGALLPLSIALLQIEGVVDTVITRTSTITTAIFATAGLLSSGTYLFFADELINSRNKTRWIEVRGNAWTVVMGCIQCTTVNGISHIGDGRAGLTAFLCSKISAILDIPRPANRFADLILSRAILTCAVTVMCIAWTNNHNNTEESQGAFIGSAIFITFLLATSVVYLYKASAMVLRNS